MHMVDALISPAVGGTMLLASTAAVTYSVKELKNDLDEKKIPVMGVMGAFVFAAQMINFTIPATGSSGHIGGGILLAALLGGPGGLLVITSVLVMQALFFADGGLLALGCNIFNIGVIPCLFIYPLIYKPIVKSRLQKKFITVASVFSVVIALQFGAFGVVLETLLSGRTELPFGPFLLLMQPIHLAIGLAEGFITAGILCFIHSVSPELLAGGRTEEKKGGRKKVVIIFAALAVITGGVVAGFASQLPDGLEWAIAKTAGAELESPEQKIYQNSAALQDKTAVLPEYAFKDSGTVGERTQTGIAGIAGSVIVLLAAGGVGALIRGFKKKKTCHAKD